MTTRTRTTMMFARMGLALSVSLLVLAGSVRAAEAAPKRLGVVTFRGPGEGATRNVVNKQGKAHRYQIVGGQAIAKTASKLKVTLDNNDSFQAVARELGIAAFVTGEVSKKKATLTVRNGADGSVTAEASWTGANPRKLSSAVGKTFWRRLGSAIDRAKAPSGAKAAVVAEEAAAPETGADDSSDDGKGLAGGKKTAAADESSDVAERRERSKRSSSEGGSDESGENVVSAKSEPEESGGGPALEALVVSVGPRVMNRSLSYTQNLYQQNRNYNLAAAPELALNLDVFPAAFSQSGFLANIGLTAAVGYMLPVVTTPATAPTTGSYKTYSLTWSVGAKVRLPYSTYATVAYGDQRFQLIRPNTGAPDIVPMVDYRYVRIGAGGRIPVTDTWTVMANLAYLQVLSFGQIGTAAYFPKVKGNGLEVGAGVAYRISPMLEIQAGAEMRRYGLAFNVAYADYMANPNTRVAGGAVDQYLMGWVNLAVVLGGSGGGASASSSSSSEEEEAAPEKSDDGEGDGGEEKSKDEESEDEKPAKGSKGSKKKALEEDL